MGVKFANPPLELGLKYHDPPHLTELKEKKVPGSLGCSIPSQQEKRGRKQKQNKRKAKKKKKKLGQKDWKLTAKELLKPLRLSGVA